MIGYILPKINNTIERRASAQMSLVFKTKLIENQRS